ncbi:MAG: phosphonoacetaldehyde reductase [Salinivirgaceae bacterium]|nr:phosphonoacetaldehyde reductase [Salinivirgaceae bacterium]MDD4746353.1 phosphonoacetaldehyde reductase [Salinivirgaceae bacterium]MDY0280125.1 phosphonoacetaldehyde reductase [Salinivirgaceae bacterium]
MTQAVFKKHQVEELKAIVQECYSKKVFLVHHKNSYYTSGAESFIQKLLGKCNSVSFFEFTPNPQIEDLKRGIALFKKDNFDLIIAIGGGSVLDMAKLISIFAHQESDVEDVVVGKGRIGDVKTPLIAIPTTAGTGAEATQFAVLYIEKNKYSVEHPLILPDYVFLSSEFSLTASPYLTACTGLDAFCQAVESAWSVNANEEAETYALRAIDIIWNNLQKAVLDQNPTAREQMQEAAFLAGKAISITKTTAPHALSYAFTSYYGIPHGHAVALSLPYFLTYNYAVTDDNCMDPRGVASVKNRIDNVLRIIKKDIKDAPTALIDFFKTLGINIDIPTLIENIDTNLIVSNVNTQRLTNNPRAVSHNDLRTFLQA